MLSIEQFMNQTSDQANATKYELVPVNDEGYLAIIAPDGIDVKDFKYKDGEQAGQTGYRLTVAWDIEDPTGELAEKLGRKPRITQSLMLDVTPEGSLDYGKGKNVQLGRLREALGQNVDGQPWSPSMMLGRAARIYVTPRINKNTGEELREVSKVVAA